MIPALDTSAPPDPIFRLGREPEAWAWPDWSYATAGTFGNRFDDPAHAYRVLYASSSRFGSFVEVLAYQAPDLATIAGTAGVIENDTSDREYPHVKSGVLDVAAFCTGRRIGEATVRTALEFAYISSARSIAALRSNADVASMAIRHGISDFDGAVIRAHHPRAFTQALSRWVFEQSSGGEARFAGIRYPSRRGDDIHNWAIFELYDESARPGWSPFEHAVCAAVDPVDQDLRDAIDLLGITALD